MKSTEWSDARFHNATVLPTAVNKKAKTALPTATIASSMVTCDQQVKQVCGGVFNRRVSRSYKIPGKAKNLT
jgi:hypothetical protein